MTGFRFSYALIPLFFLSTLFSPWWFVVAFGILLLSYHGAYVSVLAGGIFMDSIYASPEAGVVSYLYTGVFLLLIAVTVLIRGRVME
jgi:hypothetical protein